MSIEGQSFSDLQALIAAAYPELRGQMKLIAEFFIENPDQIAFGTVTEIATKVGVQPSSLVRFAKVIGHDGYSDLQRVVRSHLITSTSNYTQRIMAMRGSRPKGASPTKPGDVLSAFVDQGIASLELLRRETHIDSLTEAIDLISNARNVFLLAERRAFPVAFYLYYALSNLQRPCINLDGLGGMLRHQSMLVQPDDVIVAISFKSYSPAVAEIVSEQAEAGVRIISITDSVLSPIFASAQVAFELPEQEPHEFRTLVAPMCLAQSIAIGVGHQLASKRAIGTN